VLVYDITDRGSFTKVRNWVKELRKIVGKGIVLCIVGNKIDMEKKRQVDKEEALNYAASVGAVHCLASAKTGKGVDQAFVELTKGLLKTMQKEVGGRSGGRPKNNRRTGVVVGSAETEPKPGGCCN
jgi:Ras-related protein Rab-21